MKKSEQDLLIAAAVAYRDAVREHRRVSADRPATTSYLVYPKEFTDHMAVVIAKRGRTMAALLAAAMNLPDGPQARPYSGNGCPGIKKPARTLTGHTARRARAPK